MRPVKQYVLVERERADKTASAIITPESYQKANPFPVGKILAKGAKVDVEVEVGDRVIFQLFNATSIKGMTYHVHQKYLVAKCL